MPSRRPWLAPTLLWALLGSQSQGCGLEAVPAALLPVAAAGGLAAGGLGAWLLKPGASSPNALASTAPGAIQGQGGDLVHDGGVVFAQGQPIEVATTEGNFSTDELGEVASLGVASRQIALMLSNTQQDRVPLAPPLGATAEASSEASYQLLGLEGGRRGAYGEVGGFDGTYRVNQTTAAPPPGAPKPCNEVFRDFDRDGDQRLNKDEFVAFALKRDATGLAMAENMFLEWNANRDGFVDPAEFCQRLGAPPVDPNCVANWGRFDGNQDGLLDLTEFQRAKKATDPAQPGEDAVRAEFKQLDRDGNALLGPVELCGQPGQPPPNGTVQASATASGTAQPPGAMPLAGSPAADPACLVAFNTDAQPNVSFEEFALAMTGSKSPPAAIAEAIKATFLRLDANNSGDLDAYELCGRGPLAPGAGAPPPRPANAPPPPVVAQGSGGLRPDGSLQGRFSFAGQGDIVYQGSAPTERQNPQGATVVERSYTVDLFGEANTVVVSRPKESGAVPELGIRWKPGPQGGEVAINVRANAAELSFPGGGKGSLSALALSGGALQSQGSVTDAAGRTRDVAVGLLADGRTSCTVSERRFAVQLLFDPVGRGSGTIVDARGKTLGQLSVGANNELAVKLANGAQGNLRVVQPR